MKKYKCLICNNKVNYLNSVKFSKSCNNYILEKSDFDCDIKFYLCPNCHFCYAPEFISWTDNDFTEKIYNDDYICFDPDYETNRPNDNYKFLNSLFNNLKEFITHLDYGSGNGTLSELLTKEEWNSISYDPYGLTMNQEFSKKTYNLITAFEVFEHVIDIKKMMEDFELLLSNSGIILFSTLLSDNYIQPKSSLDWWYIGPRNGHICFYSSESLNILAETYGYKYYKLNGLHIFSKNPGIFGHLTEDKNLLFSNYCRSFLEFVDEKLNLNTNIILYGAGTISRIIIGLYPNKIKYLIDKDPLKLNMKLNDAIILNPKSLISLDFDIILITALEYSDMIKHDLIHNYNIKKEKIIFIDITR